jgi:beta-N-acetylhexosaminidase
MEIDSNKLIPYGRQMIVSVTGTQLLNSDRSFLETVRPGGIILFSENVDRESQLNRLISDIKTAAGQDTFIAVDYEGGMVNRFRKIIGDVPAMGDHQDLVAFGRQSGELLGRFGVDVNFAPVVDLNRGNSRNGLLGRTLGQDANTVIERAAAYLEGLESTGIVGCLKHYPGLGPTTPDSHFDLPVLSEIAQEDEQPFRELARPNRWVMMAHVKIAGYRDISTYSQPLLSRLKSFHSGSLVSDDLGMKALPNVPLHEKIERTLSVGMDYALVRLRCLETGKVWI